MSKDEVQDEPGTAVAIQDRAMLARFAEMATMVPLADDGGMDNIMEQILSAATWEDLDKPWETDKVEALRGKRLLVRNVERRPSDFRDGLGIFLVIHYTDTASGEMGVVTSSSVSVIGQLVRAYALGVMPVVVEFVVAERPTKNGYLPHHLKFHGGNTPHPVKADAAS